VRCATYWSICCKEHERDGATPTSARFLFYELVQRGQLSKHSTGARRPDQDLHDALTDIREDGRVPWHWIVDETRSLEDYTGYNNVQNGVLAQLDHVNIDPWHGRAPMILTESRSLAGVLRPIAQEYCCRIASTNGQCGGFLRTDIAPRLRPDDQVLYFGDLDLSGGQIEANTRRVLEQVIGGALRWERIALTQKQVDDHNLPIIIKHDRRYHLTASLPPEDCGDPPALAALAFLNTCQRLGDEFIESAAQDVHQDGLA